GPVHGHLPRLLDPPRPSLVARPGHLRPPPLPRRPGRPPPPRRLPALRRRPPHLRGGQLRPVGSDPHHGHDGPAIHVRPGARRPCRPRGDRHPSPPPRPSDDRASVWW